MAFSTKEQLVAQLRDTAGVLVAYADSETYGHLNISDEEVQGVDELEMIAVVARLTVVTGVLPALEEKAAITADGTAYTIRTWRRRDDGMTDVYLSEPGV